METDHELMAAVSRGQVDRMSDLYERKHRPLFRFFYRVTSRQQTSEDLTHEVFLRMLRYRETYAAGNQSGGFEAWMYRIARNAMVDHARKHRREAPGDEIFDSAESGEPTPFDTASKRQELATLHRAMRALPEEKRELLVLTRFQGLSHEQVGRILGCEANVIKTRVFRAMKEMGQIYSDLSREKAS